jgi:peptidyl-tRNA hydrolase, PTH1 family
MNLIVGLGNPGKTYEKTRHNIGFLTVDHILQVYHLPILRNKKEFDGAYGKTTIGTEDVILLKPDTYMNLSGNAVSKVAAYFKIQKEHIIVIHDDIDLPIGKIRIVVGSSSGGQKGVQSIIDHIGKNFIRIKIGITEGEKQKAIDHVLSPFSKKEWKVIEATIATIPSIIETILTQGTEKAQNEFN